MKEKYYENCYKKIKYIYKKIDNDKFNYKRFLVIFFNELGNISIDETIITEKYHKDEINTLIKKYINKKILK